MAAKTKIEWTSTTNEDGTVTPGHTWNFLRGCLIKSEGCRNCYAMGIAYRFSGPGLAYEGLARRVNGHAQWTGKLTVVEKDLGAPLSWQKPGRVFVNSMSDLFYEKVPFEVVDRAMTVMAKCSHLSFQILTKRPERMLEYFKDKTPLDNVWLGVSVENQKAADERIPVLLKIPAAVRFLSCEPLLGKLNLRRYFAHSIRCENYPMVGSSPDKGLLWKAYNAAHQCSCSKIHWVIAGGESGQGARPMHPDWARGLRDQCQAENVPFFFKQHGAWVAAALNPDYPPQSDFGTLSRSGDWFHTGTTWNGREGAPQDDYEYTMRKVGKKAAGRLLDGIEWNQFPEVVNQ